MIFFYESIFAGIAIGLGGLAKLVTANTGAANYAAALAFSIGIIMVMAMKFKLYTGFTPTFSNFEKPIPKFFICLGGNFVGATLVGILVRFANPAIGEVGLATCEGFATQGYIKPLLSAIVCGIIIACIVRIKNEIIKYLMSLPLIALFIMSGCHHVVADFFYMACGFKWDVLLLLVVAIGNTIGGLMFGFYDIVVNARKARGESLRH